MAFLYVLSDIVFFFLYYLIKYRRKVVFQNLRNSFKNKNDIELRKIEKRFYHHFCDVTFESLKSLTISKDMAMKRFRVKNPDLIQKYFEQKKNIILYAAHFGNWEWLSFLPLFFPYQVTTFYQALSNKYFDDLMKIRRERFGVMCFESDKGYRAIISFKQKNILTLNFIIGDQSPRKSSSKHWINFLNQETAFLVGADRIAKKSNQIVIFPAYTKKKRGFYEIEFKIIEEEIEKKNSNEIINKYAKLLEESITNSPELWLWSHRRWKLKRELDN